MAYFNHAYQKTLCGTQGLFTKVGSDTTKNHVWDMKDAGSGKVAIFSSKTHEVLSNDAEPQKFYVAASSLRTKDKIGKFAGGYQEANKTKEINPKYVRRIYRVNQKNPSQGFIELGNTSELFKSCTKSFSCGTTYYLNLNVKGGSIVSTLRHEAYSDVPAFVSCCDQANPTSPLGYDGAEVYIEWAKAIANNPIFDGFVVPAVALNTSGTTWKYYVMTNEDKTKFANAYLSGNTSNVGLIEDIKFGSGSGEIEPAKAGLVVVAAYAETKFGDCTWQVTDRYDIEPLRIYATEVDSEGEPCFNALCVKRTEGTQGYGFGESVIRRIILDESYHQRFFNNDLRKREIESDNNIFTVVNRSAMYDSLYILHSVPRFDNPSGTFDNDNYLIEIVASNATIDTLITTLASLVPDVECEVYGGEDTSVSVVKGPKNITIDLASGSTPVKVVKTYTIDPKDGKLSTTADDYVSEDSTIATAVREAANEGNEVSITGKAAGSTTITLPGGYVINVTVNA